MAQKKTATQTATATAEKVSPEQKFNCFCYEYTHAEKTLSESEKKLLKDFGLTDEQIADRQRQTVTDTMTVDESTFKNFQSLSDFHKSLRLFLLSVMNDTDSNSVCKLKVSSGEKVESYTLTAKNRNGQTKENVIFTFTTESGEIIKIDIRRPLEFIQK